MKKIILFACLAVLALFIIGCKPAGEAIAGQKVARYVAPPPEAPVLNQAPNAVITGQDFVAKNSPITFSGVSSYDVDGSIVSYSWQFGDGSPIQTGPVVTQVYTSFGEFTVKLTVIDDKGASGMATKNVRVGAVQTPIPGAAAGPAQIACTTDYDCTQHGLTNCVNGICS